MENFITGLAGGARAGNPAQNAATAFFEAPQNGGERYGVDAFVLRQIVHAESDLGAGRSHKAMGDAGGNGAFFIGELLHDAIEVRAHDRGGAAFSEEG